MVDLQWNPVAPWTLLSLSNDVNHGGGGTLQLWRPLDLLLAAAGEEEEAAVRELEAAAREALQGGATAASAGKDADMPPA